MTDTTILCLIYKETGNGLKLVDRVRVPAASPDPEGAAWTAWTRGADRASDNYAVMRAGKRFAITAKSQQVASSLGAMT